MQYLEFLSEFWEWIIALVGGAATIYKLEVCAAKAIVNRRRRIGDDISARAVRTICHLSGATLFVLLSLAAIRMFQPDQRDSPGQESPPLGSNDVAIFNQPSRTVFIEGLVDQELQKRVASALGMNQEERDSAAYRIRIGYTGSIYEKGDSLHAHYGGGCLVISINGVTCESLEDAKLQEWEGGLGNPLGVLGQQLQAEVDALVEVHFDAIIEAVVTCMETSCD